MKYSISTLFVCLTCAVPVFSQDEGLSLKVAAGGEYDSNITVVETDTSTNTGDFAAIIDLAIGYKMKAVEDVNIEFGYDFSQSLYADETDFNLQMHAFTFNADTEMNGLDLGLAYGFYNNRLGGDKFLDMHTISPNVAIFFGESNYLRGDYTYYKKSFTVLDERDANTHSFGANYYHFTGDGAFFSIGLRYEKENANSDEFDYSGLVARAGFQTKFELMNDEAKFNASVEYKDRNYDNVTMSIGEKRDDQRTTFRANLSVPIYNKITINPEFRYINSSSNLASADYKESIIGATFGYSF